MKAVVPVSVVIPTCNRAEEVKRLLGQLQGQTVQPAEVLVVDASTPPLALPDYELPLKLFHMPAHLCRQRNRGIACSQQPMILLCDDDMDLPANYLQSLVEFLMTHPEEGAVSGLWLEPQGRGAFQAQFPETVASLCWKFLFQLPVWGSLPRASSRWQQLGLIPIRKFYRWRGNRWTLAGWPLITQWEGPVIHTAFYSLGACLIRREWLGQNPFDEHLDPFGIGDNYGVAMKWPYPPGIAVLPEVPVRHRRSPQHRLEDPERFEHRLQALSQFIRQSSRFSPTTRLWLGWSFLGLWIQHRRAGNHRACRAISRAWKTLWRTSPATVRARR